MFDLVLSRVGVAGSRDLVDVAVQDGVVTDIGARLACDAEVVIDGEGGVLLPGLHDHHVHLLAAAAARRSVRCGPPEVCTAEDLRTALTAATPVAGWIRGVGYDEGVAGPLDRFTLDGIRTDVAVRVQHRGGSVWLLNSVAVDRLALDSTCHEGVERDADGRPTGRLWRADGLLRERLPFTAVPELSALSVDLARYGVTGVTDATPGLDARAVAALTGPAVRQRMVLLGWDGPAPCKIVVADHDLPRYDRLREQIAATRPRPVALHCVTGVALLLSLAVFDEVGTVAGDRIEHAAVVPPGAAAHLAALELTVVTQPSFVRRRGDDYLDRVEPDERELLWPFASLDAAGVGVACSSDMPYGSTDPWETIRSAVERTAPSGRRVAAHEAVTAERALRGFLTEALDPGGPPRRVVPGLVADLVLLDRPLAEILARPTRDAVRMTIIGGELVG